MPLKGWVKGLLYAHYLTDVMDKPVDTFSELELRWCFKPSQPLRIVAGLRLTHAGKHETHLPIKDLSYGESWLHRLGSHSGVSQS